MSFTPSTLSPGSSPPFWVLFSPFVSCLPFQSFISVSQGVVLVLLLFLSHTPLGESHPFPLLQFCPINWWHPNLCPDPHLHLDIPQVPQTLCSPKPKSLPPPKPGPSCSLPCFVTSTSIKSPGLDDLDSPLTHIPYLHRKFLIKSWRFFLCSISGFCCFSITTYFGSSFFLSGFIEYPSLSTLFTKLYHKYPADTELKQSWSWAHSACGQKTNLFCVAFKALHTLVPPGILAYEVTTPFMPLCLCFTALSVKSCKPC